MFFHSVSPFLGAVILSVGRSPESKDPFLFVPVMLMGERILRLALLAQNNKTLLSLSAHQDLGQVGICIQNDGLLTAGKALLQGIQG